jgi:colanic acid/amylovoran biosynthesis glycosyltransferase
LLKECLAWFPGPAILNLRFATAAWVSERAFSVQTLCTGDDQRNYSGQMETQKVSKDARTLGIVLEYAPAPSETFISNHIALLPANIVTIQGWRPSIDGRNVLSLPSRAFHKLQRSVSGAGLERETTAAYVKAFRRHHVAAVLAEYGTTGSMTVDACRQLHIPLIVYFFGYDATVTSVLEEHAASYRLMFQEACAIIAISRSIGRRLVLLGAPPEKIHYIPCGVDCGRFTGADPQNAPPVFLAVGRFVEKKAPQLTIKAFARVHSTYPAARLRMIGDGPLLNESQELAKTLGVAESVEFLGTQTHTVVGSEMHQARCFVQHSVEAVSGDCEGTPVGILEAGGTGLPVISTRHSGIPDVVIEGETGFLVDEGDIEGMATNMLRIAEDPALAARLGHAARRRMQDHFSLEATISALWKVIESCMNGSPVVGQTSDKLSWPA